MTPKLPPLKSLVFFEAAARLGSFTLAAKERNVTQGAVSRQITNLEQFLGTKLFRRANRQITLTDDGQTYYLTVANSLRQLTTATNDLLLPIDSSQVSVLTSGALAQLFMMPRIPSFRDQFSDIQVRIIARDSIDEINRSQFDIALYFSASPPKGYVHHPLLREIIYPVCSPAFEQSNRASFDPGGLPHRELVWLETSEKWKNWPDWFAAMGIPFSGKANTLVVNAHTMAIQAAIAGQGMALAWDGLVDQELETGQLVRPTDMVWDTGSRFYLLIPEDRSMGGETEIFYNWICRSVSERQVPG